MNRIERSFVLVALTLMSVAPSCVGQVAGEWQGMLVPPDPAPKMRLLLHVAEAKDGSLTGSVDLIDQGINTPLTKITVKDSKLVFAIDAFQVSYEGTVNKDASKIDGTYTQGTPLPLNFTRVAAGVTASKPAPPSEIDGTWQGTMNFIGMKAPVIFNIVNTGDGLKLTEELPYMGAMKMQAASAVLTGSSLTAKFNGTYATYQGDLFPDHDFIDGAFAFFAGSSPLRLMRVEDRSQIDRPHPQNPIKPYPYREEEVTYDNHNAGDTLAGTLTIPQGKGPFPAVLLIACSGVRDRDESAMGHKPFLVLSDYLTRHGIIVLRVDKRGVGKSSGDYAASTTAHFATDADAGVAFLKTRAEVDPHKIGLIGHSEGGEIAPMVAARNNDVAFVVMMAGPAVPGDQILAEQVRLAALAGGANEEKAIRDAALERELLTLIETEKDEDVLDKELHDKLIASGKSEDQSRAQIKEFGLPWFRFFIGYDPATALREVKCPVLALGGSKDLQVPAAQNLPAVRKALEAGGNKRSEVEEIPGLNHLFQTAATGSPTEYAQIEQTISPAALEKISAWVLKQ